jgi:alkylation response protein AidB-like acyl-CoA dehydrogenase
MVASSTALYLPLSARETYEKAYCIGPDLVCSGSGYLGGTAEQEADGWRVNGRWPFASGCQDADWIAGICVLTRDGKPFPTSADPNARRVAKLRSTVYHRH